MMSSGKYILLVAITFGAWSKVNCLALWRFDRYEKTQPVLNTLLTASMNRNRCAVWCFNVDKCVAISLRNGNTSDECVVYPVNAGHKRLRLYPSTEWTTYVKGTTSQKIFLYVRCYIIYIHTFRKSVKVQFRGLDLHKGVEGINRQRRSCREVSKTLKSAHEAGPSIKYHITNLLKEVYRTWADKIILEIMHLFS